MCRFCVEHGEGERWYLQAGNYAADLSSDLKRREFMVDFIAGFEDMRAGALVWGERLDKLPTPLSRVGKYAISRYMQPNHFGQPVPIEECARILDIATSVTVIPCICRMHAPGQRAQEVCILVTTQPVEAILAEGFRDYENGPGLDDFRQVNKRQAMALLERCEHEGLMHSVWTFKTPFTAAICNCNLESGCMAMRMNSGYGVKTMWRGEWVMTLDQARCVNCKACVRVCPFDAISSNGRVAVHADQCWGCGICRSACSHDALEMVERSTVPEVAGLW